MRFILPIAIHDFVRVLSIIDLDRRLIIATGMWKPNIPPISGLDLAQGYETLSTDPDIYQGKSVLILGEFFMP